MDAPDSETAPPGPDGTVGKALDVLDLVARYGRPARFTDLLAQAPYPKATLYRLLQVLVRQGMLRFDAEQARYAPGLRLVRLAHAAWAQSALGPIARPYLRALAEATGETVHLAQLDEGQVLYIEKLTPVRPVEMFSQAGKIGPAYCTGVGKAMLAFLPEADQEAALARQSFHAITPQTLNSAARLRVDLEATRARGFALDREEHEPGILCCAVPVLSARGRVLAGLSVTSTTARTTPAALEAHLPGLRDCAARIAAAAGDWGFPEG